MFCLNRVWIHYPDSLPDYDTLDTILELYVEQEKSHSDILAVGYRKADVDWVRA